MACEVDVRAFAHAYVPVPLDSLAREVLGRRGL